MRKIVSSVRFSTNYNLFLVVVWLLFTSCSKKHACQTIIFALMDNNGEFVSCCQCVEGNSPLVGHRM